MKAGLCFYDNMLSGTTKICILLQSEHLTNAYMVTKCYLKNTNFRWAGVHKHHTPWQIPVRQNQTGKICFYLNL